MGARGGCHEHPAGGCQECVTGGCQERTAGGRQEFESNCVELLREARGESSKLLIPTSIADFGAETNGSCCWPRSGLQHGGSYDALGLMEYRSDLLAAFCCGLSKPRPGMPEMRLGDSTLDAGGGTLERVPPNKRAGNFQVSAAGEAVGDSSYSCESQNLSHLHRAWKTCGANPAVLLF